MARKPTGQVVERKTRRGTVFALRFRAYGDRQYVTLGTAADGVTRATAEDELANVLADVRRGTWSPPRPDRDTPTEEDRPREVPTFHEFSSEWFHGLANEDLRQATLDNYEWQLTHHLLPHFGHYRLTDITVQEIDRYRRAKVAENERRQDAIDSGKPFLDDRGRVLRPLSATSINKTITRLGQILEVALEYDHVPRNEVRINSRKRKVKVRAPQRSYLDRSEQITALLDAAAALDAGARLDRRHIPRRTVLLTLVLSGLRIGELINLRWRDVRLGSGTIAVPDSKTDAGVRDVELLPALREALAEWKATSRHAAPEDYVFATATGGQPSATNIRKRVLVPAVESANAALRAKDHDPLPDRLTPHSLRRTFASLLFAVGRDAPVVMEQMGHSDPKLTLRIYARAMRRDEGEKARLHALAGLQAPSMGTGAHSTPAPAPMPVGA